MFIGLQPQLALRPSGGFVPSSLFLNGEQGAWLDPSDLSTMWQDSAGTTPVTVPGGGSVDPPVGKMLDKSGRGNHVIQATGAARPTLSGRYNILTGTATMGTQSQTTIAASYTLSIYGTGSVTLSGTSVAGPLNGTGANNRVTLVFTPTAGTLTLTVAGSVTTADLRLTADTVLNIPAYQSVTDASNYSIAGFPLYLTGDGIDNGMATAATVDFTGTSQMTVWAGVTKLSDAAAASIVDLSAAPNSTAGTFQVVGPNSAASNYAFGTFGTVAGNVRVATTYAAPITNVVAASLDNTAGTAALQVIPLINGVAPSLSAGTLSTTGAYINSTLYLMRRGGTSLPFNGRLYQLIIRGAASSATQIAQGNRFVGAKTGIPL